MQNAHCPLCGDTQTSTSFTRSPGVKYLKCSVCALIFIEEKFRLDPIAEKEQYDLHENDVHDERYQKFMEPLIRELLSRSPGKKGLDFGSGPTSVLKHLLEPDGFKISLFDKFYYPDSRKIEQSYDFIFASEVVEHMADPSKEFTQIHRLLKAGGLLIVGTSLYDEVSDLSTWSYAKDPTHISFFSKKTFEWLASKFAFEEPYFFSRRGILLRKALK